MDVILNTKDFQEAVEKVHLVADERAVIPALSCVRIDVTEDGFVKFTGYNMEVSIETTIQSVNYSVSFSTLINGRMLNEVAKKCFYDETRIEYDESGNICSIKSGKANYKLQTMAVDNFAELPETDGMSAVNVPADKFFDAANSVCYAVSTDDKHPAHTGVSVQTLFGGIEVIALDGYRMSHRKINLETETDIEFEVIVPANTIKMANKIFKNEKDKISIFASKSFIAFKSENDYMISRLLSGQFLDWRKVISGCDGGDIFKFDREELVEAIQGAMIMLDKGVKLSRPCIMRIHDGKCELTIQTTVGTFNQDIYVNTDFSGDISVGFNPKYLLDCMNAIYDENIQMEIKSSLSPVMVREIGKIEDFELVLPVRFKE